MLLIVGRKIILQKGDDESFLVVLRDHKGREISLSDSDYITLRMRYSRETSEEIYLSKTAKIINFPENSDNVYHIINFTYSDTIDLPEGDYYYDVILEYDNKRFTIVPKSIFTLENSISLDDIDNNLEDVTLFDADTKIDYESVIASTPLYGIFPEKSYKKSDSTNVEIDSEIIKF